MDFGWLKQYFPRSLFGRALLIMLFPVVGLQLIVGQVFIQRHFQSVTKQMAQSVSLEINYAIQIINLAGNVEAAQSALDEISVNLELLLLLSPDMQMPKKDSRFFYDVSGKALIESLHEDISQPLRVDLRQSDARVGIWVATPKGVLEIVLPRARVSANNPHQLLVLMMFASVVLVVISVGFLRVQVRPIRRLAEAAEAYGKGQQMPLHPSGSTEVRRAALAFLTMRNKLDRQMEQRTQMLSGVSHDLRTPLTRMKLALEFMDDTGDLDRDIVEMERMLAGFLAFAKDDKQEQGIASDVIALAKGLVLKSQRSGTEIEFISKIGSSNKTNVVLRPKSIQRAVQNLLDNAAKYANKTRFSLLLTDSFVEFRIEDDGPGIPTELYNIALQPFERLDKSRTSDGSVGLGLSIAADVARAHGGTLELSQSKDMGGLCVRLTIPR